MFHPSTEVFLPIAIMTIIFGAGTIIPISITWLQQRTKTKAIEVLKIYAERGQEPPASVMDAVNRINWPFPQNATPPKPMRDQSRGEHLSHVAGSACIAAGSAIVLWWQVSSPQPRFEWLMITAIFTTIFFTASGAARLVAALAAPADGKR